LINIDGSYGEGGGQILRNSVALSFLFNEEVQIKNIRANRPNPGIKPQHYTAIDIIKNISDAKTVGLKIGSSNLSFSHVEIKGGSYEFDIGTAGSIVLVFQACILSFLKTKKIINIKLKGGTDVKWSPSWDYFENVFLRLLRLMGISVKSKLISRGYYPKGGGEAILTIEPSNIIRPLNIDENQEFREIYGIINIANLPTHIAARMKHASIKKIIENNLNASIKIDATTSFSAGTGITLWSRSKDTILGKTKLGEKGVSAETIGEITANSLITEIRSGASIDTNSIDQILPYMFLASNYEPSICLVKDLSGHTMTNIWLLSQFIKNKNIFKITNKKNLSNIEIHGINYLQNKT